MLHVCLLITDSFSLRVVRSKRLSGAPVHRLIMIIKFSKILQATLKKLVCKLRTKLKFANNKHSKLSTSLLFYNYLHFIMFMAKFHRRLCYFVTSFLSTFSDISLAT